MSKLSKIDLGGKIEDNWYDLIRQFLGKVVAVKEIFNKNCLRLSFSQFPTQIIQHKFATQIMSVTIEKSGIGGREPKFYPGTDIVL